ncbi:hypothetical protein KAR91_31730 [Candidatus Pacearchaeota archaeon]|nr:hypothetical protein [Candidatus Pacearchaeota archaeon]
MTIKELLLSKKPEAMAVKRACWWGTAYTELLKMEQVGGDRPGDEEAEDSA